MPEIALQISLHGPFVKEYVIIAPDRLFIRRYVLGSRLRGYTHNG